ncbi:hypothetical protein EK21DRAFT_100353 [Setomelanomma holmii]|uniref:Microbial-type PARG catalytic domain-containing protein n=1 Tax=Setomelanomma holmii TaxID=210430 RepID=A0A9P4LNH7_9PLEO|nr:hypothetical protein EK21DRAFT_100353 [Setomelanomma holmii]
MHGLMPVRVKRSCMWLGNRTVQHTLDILDLATRRKICEDTILRSANVAASTPGGSLSSTFISGQLPPLSKEHIAFPDFSLRPIQIHDSDAFALARTLACTGKVGVTQEEALCYSSTLFATLNPDWYPWPNTGLGSCAGIFSPDVVVFRDTLDNDLAELPVTRRHVLAVITVAAPCLPNLTSDGQEFADALQLQDLVEKILLVLRMAALNGVTSLVLGAMGCGAYGYPPKAVAETMKRLLTTEEFDGWFENVLFAVHAAGPTGKPNLRRIPTFFWGCATLRYVISFASLSLT